jgi:hypothetical protein
MFFEYDIPMPSTVIKSFEYDASSGTLTIRFVSGSVYAYYEVAENVYEEFRQFREKGIFYNQQIKGKFRFERISADK